MDSPLETVQRQWTAFEQLDVDGIADLWHPEIEWDNSHSKRAVAVVRGKAEVLEFLSRYMAAWQGYRLDAEGFEAAGDLVLAKVRHHGIPPGGDGPVTEEYAMLHTVRDGLVLRTEVFNNRSDGDAAFERLALAEG